MKQGGVALGPVLGGVAVAVFGVRLGMVVPALAVVMAMLIAISLRRAEV